jgi:hypothetical protein
VITLKVDGTDWSPEFLAALQSVGADSTSVVAVYPDLPPHKPIVINAHLKEGDCIEEEDVIIAINRAKRRRW